VISYNGILSFYKNKLKKLTFIQQKMNQEVLWIIINRLQYGLLNYKRNFLQKLGTIFKIFFFFHILDCCLFHFHWSKYVSCQTHCNYCVEKIWWRPTSKKEISVFTQKCNFSKIVCSVQTTLAVRILDWLSGKEK